VPVRKTSAATVTMNALLGCALGVLFVALLVASAQGPAQDVWQRPDAALPLLCLLANMSALLATAVVGTAWSLSAERRAPHRQGPGSGRRVPVAVRVGARGGR
jgi:hypothetical protein